MKLGHPRVSTLGHGRTRERLLKGNNLVFTNKRKMLASYGLEVPVVYDFVGPARFVIWIKGKLQICKTNLDKKNKWLK